VNTLPATLFLATWLLLTHAYADAAPASVANRDALRRIVQDQCVVNWTQQHSVAPCESLELPTPPHEREGYALLADRKGGAHFLLIPTKTVSGMESPELFEAGTPNYFAAAWRARDRIAARVGRAIPRGTIGLALNPQHHRTQDQLHIHIECLRADIAKVLQSVAPRVHERWTDLNIEDSRYHAVRIMGEELDRVDPVKLLAAKFPSAKSPAGNYTLVVAGMSFAEGPGFIVLARTGAAGELLLDSECANE
jgi:CDP-diacylglycerol pyrophosphatase